MEKNAVPTTVRKKEERLRQQDIPKKIIHKRNDVPELMKLGKEKEKGQSPDPVSSMERMVGRKLNGEEIYCLNW